MAGLWCGCERSSQAEHHHGGRVLFWCWRQGFVQWSIGPDAWRWWGGASSSTIEMAACSLRLSLRRFPHRYLPPSLAHSLSETALVLSSLRRRLSIGRPPVAPLHSTSAQTAPRRLSPPPSCSCSGIVSLASTLRHTPAVTNIHSEQTDLW